MISKDSIKKIITYGTMAPSGENCQPWKFSVRANTISISNIPERDTSIYNRSHSGDYIAHGALIENICIAAHHEGYTAKILYPSSEKIAEIELVEKASEMHKDLFSAIPKRSTNRKPFKKIGLEPQNREQLIRDTENFQNVFLESVTEPSKIETLATAASMNERLLFQNKHLHTFFFSHINWNKQEDIEKSIGFFVDTLELPPPAKLIFKLAKKWSRMTWLQKIGIPTLVAKANQATYTSAGEILVFSVPAITKQNLLELGRALQRTWLMLTAWGFSVQPMSAVLFIHYAITNHTASELAPEEVAGIEKQYKAIESTLAKNNLLPIMMIRVGKAEKPTAHSSRLEPLIIWES